MASDREYLDYILEQLRGLDDISYRAMMGEFIIYYRDKVVGGIYDNRFLVKPVSAAVAMTDEPIFELPYEGGREMLLVGDVDDREYLEKLLNVVYDELPEPKKKQKNT